MNLIPQQLPLPQSPNTQFINLIPQQLPLPPITEHTIIFFKFKQKPMTWIS
jgi:hypothetical protein